MLVKKTSKNQFTLPKAFLKEAGLTDKDDYFEATYDARRHFIWLKPVRIVIEEKLSDAAIERFESEALKLGPEDEVFKSRKQADQFLEERIKK